MSRAHSTPSDKCALFVPPSLFCLVDIYIIYIYIYTRIFPSSCPLHTIYIPSVPVLNLIHTTVSPVLDEAATKIRAQKEDVTRLVSVASKHPFYKYNHIWSRELQNLVSSISIFFSQTQHSLFFVCSMGHVHMYVGMLHCGKTLLESKQHIKCVMFLFLFSFSYLYLGIHHPILCVARWPTGCARCECEGIHDD